ncbi:MAG TPA: DUF4129 domain-containing protein [Mycobacteriales bacterium]|nr:DUF4129 domain-containing protein [Mycobacteriales bacterium]
MSPLCLAAEIAALAPVGRDEARRAAERELSKGMYHRNDPSPIERAIAAALEWLDKQLSRTADATPGGGLGLLVLVLAIVGVLVFVAWRIGPVRRSARGGRAKVELSGPLDADEHRRRAEAFAAEGRYAEAVRERMRAIVRELEARGVLEPRPGRTADEVAHNGGGAVPAVAPDLRAAAGVFDEVWYGGRTATAEADAVLRQADQRVRRTQLAVTGTGRPAADGYQVPR